MRGASTLTKILPLIFALLVQILAPAGAQVAMARAMQSGAAPICAPVHGQAPSPEQHGAPDACCALCAFVHAGAAPPLFAPPLAAREAPVSHAPAAPRDDSGSVAFDHALRPPARASPSV